MKPADVTGLGLAFGGDMKQLMVPMVQVPEEFKDLRTPWNDVVSHWFFRGLPGETEFTPKDGIDATKALRHLGAILRSFEPRHEDKEACVAYLMSLWFDGVVIPGEPRISIVPPAVDKAVRP